MPKIDILEKAPHTELHVFYVLDTSESMSGSKISVLNHTMEECTEALKTLAKTNGDAELKIAVLEFNSSCNWVTKNGPESMEEFEWEYLDTGGLTNVGAALRELDSRLSSNGFLNSMTGVLMPVIIFMTDGCPTDEYESALHQIRKNKWFKRGTKIGFAIGDDADEAMIASVVGNSEAVIKTIDLERFKRLMQVASVPKSVIVSQSQNTATDTSGDTIIRDAKKEFGLPDSITPHLSDSGYDKEPENTDKDDGWDDTDW